MQRDGEADADTCAYNDLALVRLDPADHASVNPSIPFWGGPTGITDTVATGAKVLSYGNSSLRQGITQLSPKEGASLGQSGGGWTHSVFTVTPGIPGDSGAPSSTSRAAPSARSRRSRWRRWPAPTASATCRASSPTPASHGADVTLATGTEAFRGPLLPLP